MVTPDEQGHGGHQGDGRRQADRSPRRDGSHSRTEEGFAEVRHHQVARNPSDAEGRFFGSGPGVLHELRTASRISRRQTGHHSQRSG